MTNLIVIQDTSSGVAKVVFRKAIKATSILILSSFFTINVYASGAFSPGGGAAMSPQFNLGKSIAYGKTDAQVVSPVTPNSSVKT